MAGGADLTVSAVEDGKRAAIAIDAHLRASGGAVPVSPAADPLLAGAA